MATGMSKKIRYGVIGLGHIAQEAVLPAFKHAKSNSVLAALITEDPKKAKDLSRKYKVPLTYSYEQFDDLLKSNVIDALYIALPNDQHMAFAMKAVKAGLHVLCEKPLVIKPNDAVRLQQAVEKNKVKFMTAYRLHFEASNLRAQEICRRGDLGELRYFSSDFSYQLEDPQNIRLDAEKGGGTLWDIGVYCINAARNAFREEPLEVFAFQAKGHDRRFTEVEEMVSAVMRFPEGRLASFNCSFGASAAADYQVFGTKGSLCLENAYEYSEPRTLTVTIDDKDKVYEYKKVDQFGPEIHYFSDCILKNRKVEPSIVEGLADVQVVRALYESLRTGKPVRVWSSGKKTQRPKLSMRRSYPAIRKPKEVHVNPPHS